MNDVQPIGRHGNSRAAVCCRHTGSGGTALGPVD
ncbi:hypothetical protein P3T37_000112 [Kitasatospora sp. MAA4]|nr:hypothetical protein [Kitasatospora sp. MAA4]